MLNLFVFKFCDVSLLAFEVIEAVVLRFNKAITRRQASRVAAEGVKVHVNPALLNAFTTLIYNSLTNYLVSNMYVVISHCWFLGCFSWFAFCCNLIMQW